MGGEVPQTRSTFFTPRPAKNEEDHERDKRKNTVDKGFVQGLVGVDADSPLPPCPPVFFSKNGTA